MDLFLYTFYSLFDKIINIFLIIKSLLWTFVRLWLEMRKLNKKYGIIINQFTGKEEKTF